MAENELEEGEEKKSSKKIIIIAAAVVLLLAGGGAGYYFMAGDPAAEGEQVEEVEEEVDEEEVEGANKEIYYDLSSALVVNLPKGSSASLIQVSVSVLVKGEDTIEALKKHEPMIRNNLLMAISAQGSDNLRTREGKEALREKMLKEISQIMERMTKKNKIINIFFTSFVMQ